MEDIFTDAETRATLLNIPLVGSSDFASWISTPPRFTVARLNRLRENPHLEKDIEEHLEKQYRKKGCLPPRIVQQSALPDVLVLESSGANRDLEPSGKVVVVGYLCGCAVLRGADVFAPGVLGAPSSLREGDAVAVFADVESKCLRGTKTAAAEEEEEGKDGERAGRFVGNGIARMSREQLFKTDNPTGVAVEMLAPAFDCPSLDPLSSRGLITLQNLPSVVCSGLLRPRPGETVMDMCAAPGGKTTHLAEMMCGKGTLVALDKSRSKVAQIEANFKRLGIPEGILHAFVLDARRSVLEEREDHERSLRRRGVEDGPPFPPGTFDRVLLDAPCSALGQRPQFVVRTGRKELGSFPRLQRKLLRAAVSLLRPGGTLVYSTCTITVEENEETVAWAMREFECLSLEDAAEEAKLGNPNGCGGGLSTENGLRAEEARNVLRFSCPAGGLGNADFLTDTIGFFIAKFSKDEEGATG